MGCENPEIQGLSWNDENQLMEVESNFCSGCDCPKNEIQIVQNDENLLWASPCAAGCKTDLGGSTFSNCTCSSGITYIVILQKLKPISTKRFRLSTPTLAG